MSATPRTPSRECEHWASFAGTAAGPNFEEVSRRRYSAPLSISLVYAGLGEKEKAIAWLAWGCDEHDPWLAQFLRNYHQFDRLRADPRFVQIMKHVGVKPAFSVGDSERKFSPV